VSAEDDFRATLAANASLVSLVGDRVSQNAIPEGSDLPAVVFTSSHDRQLSLMGDLLADEVTFSVECWATTAAVADAVADAVMEALNGAPSEAAVGVLSRSSATDGELGLDATVLTVSWWAA